MKNMKRENKLNIKGEQEETDKHYSMSFTFGNDYSFISTVGSMA